MNRQTSKPKIETPCEKQKSKKLCPKHKRILEYYCQTCAEPLCSDCLFELCKQSEQPSNNKHKEHDIIKMCEKGKAQLKQLESYHQSLTSISKNLQNRLDTLKQQQNSLHAQKKDLKTRTTENFLALVKDVKTHSEQIREESKTTTGNIHNQITSIQADLEESDLIIKSPDPKVVPFCHSNAAKLCNKGYQFSQLKPPRMALDNKLTLPSHKFTVQIECFLTARNNIQFFYVKPNYIYSDQIECFGCQWRAKIFPNGTDEVRGTHLSVSVELVSGAQTSSNFTYQLKIVAPNSKTGSFSKNFTTESDWARIIPISSVADYLDINGTLTMEIFITPSTYSIAISQNDDEYQRVSSQWKSLKNYIKEENGPQ